MGFEINDQDSGLPSELSSLPQFAKTAICMGGISITHCVAFQRIDKARKAVEKGDPRAAHELAAAIEDEKIVASVAADYAEMLANRDIHGVTIAVAASYSFKDLCEKRGAKLPNFPTIPDVPQ